MPGLNTGMRPPDALSFSDAQCGRSHSDRTLARGISAAQSKRRT
jgi:hypothetical protein